MESTVTIGKAMHQLQQFFGLSEDECMAFGDNYNDIDMLKSCLLYTSQVTIDGDTLQLDEPFIVIATENPIETAGTYPLPEAQLDRFLMKLEMGYPDKEEEITILNRFLKDNPIEDISNVCSKEDIKAMKNEVKNIYIHPSLIEYIVKLAEVTRLSLIHI